MGSFRKAREAGRSGDAIELIGKGWWKEVKEELLACIESAGRDLRFATSLTLPLLFVTIWVEIWESKAGGGVVHDVPLVLRTVAVRD